MAQPEAPLSAEARFKLYFTNMAPNYGHLTGNTTRDVLASFLKSDATSVGIDSSSTILDIAGGPGTAAEAIVDWCSQQEVSPVPQIVVTDFVPAMIDALEVIKATNPKWEVVTGKVMDSQALTFSDDTFTHTFCNFSIFTFTHPQDALKEIHRTLKTEGLAVISCWKRFGVDEIMRAAQKVVKGNDYANLIGMAGPQFATEGYVAELVEMAGWEKGNVQTLKASAVVKGADLDGLIKFMSGPFAAMAQKDWTDEEKGRWPEALKEAVRMEIEERGGFRVEGWVVLARK
jgi:ubiquinone/menaquinone biosynthesis C-methylase UbiE